MGIVKKELSKEGPKSRTELYALLSEAKHLFAAAITATTGTPQPEQAKAGYQIFTATLNALQYYPSADELPTFDEVKFDGSTNDAIFPIPVLATLGYFRNDVHAVCLQTLNFKPNHTFDTAVLAYPNTILWGQPALMRFFTDLIKVFSGETNRFPLLSNPRVRAYQLCRYGHLILENELGKIGEPLHAQIYLPNN